jgi:hypothetical protein
MQMEECQSTAHMSFFLTVYARVWAYRKDSVVAGQGWMCLCCGELLLISIMIGGLHKNMIGGRAKEEMTPAESLLKPTMQLYKLFDMQ